VAQANRRLVDTRATHLRLRAQQSLRLAIQGGHLLTVTVVSPSSSGWLAVYPCDGSSNGTSTMSYARTDVATSGSVLMSASSFCVMATSAADIIVDDQATFPST
jgi:hypothetical protein